MKIAAWFEPPAQEVDVEVGPEQILAFLKQPAETKADAMTFANAAAQVFKGIDDGIIRQMSEGQRKTIGDYLRTQADRFFDDPSKAVIEPELIAKSTLTGEEADVFRSESRQTVMKDLETGLTAVFYVHPDGRTLMDKIR